MVRYLYMLFDRILSTMQEAKQTIMQDMHTFKKSQNLISSVSAVECNVCGKGLQDGHSITAKTLSNGTVLFCDIHYSLQ